MVWKGLESIKQIHIVSESLIDTYRQGGLKLDHSNRFHASKDCIK